MRLLRATLMFCTLALLLGAPSAQAQTSLKDHKPYHDPEYNETPNVVLGERFAKPEAPDGIDLPLGTREGQSPGSLPFTGAQLVGVILVGSAAIWTGIVLTRHRRAREVEPD